ncbi:MAG: stage V sporulation protein AC [Clostridia bacterium]|nr:stage V sporulation protein AC [Clostridia bacterium]
MDKKEYKKIVDKKTPSSKLFTNCIKAFLFGGAICTIGQLLFALYEPMGMSEELTGGAVSVTLIFLGVLLTGLNIYPKLAKHAGAGTIVPITGFANSVASPAIEAKTEGMVMGVGAKLFTIAGPVIVYGVVSAFAAGIWYYIASIM